MTKLQNLSPEKQLFVLIFSVLFVQLIGRYYSYAFIYFGSFNALIFGLRFFIPILLVYTVFRFSWRDLGLGAPKLSKAWKIFLVIYIVLVPVIISTILTDKHYLRFYAQYSNPFQGPWPKLLDFGLFTLSTFFAWEFLHRGFLLFGLKKLLFERMKLDERYAVYISIAWVACFESLYHLIKPDLEAFGLLLASPVFSWIAIRTKSLWIPLLCHLYIEVLFICFVVFGAS